MKNAIVGFIALSALSLSCGQNHDEFRNRGASTSSQSEVNLDSQHEEMEQTIALLSKAENQAIVSSNVARIVQAIGGSSRLALAGAKNSKRTFDSSTVAVAVNTLISNNGSLKSKVNSSKLSPRKNGAALWQYTGQAAASGPGGFIGYAGSTFVDTETGLNAFVGQAYLGLVQALLLGVGQTPDGGVCAAAWYLDAATTTNLISEFLSYAPLSSLLNARVGSCCIDAAATKATCQDIRAGTPPVVYPLK